MPPSRTKNATTGRENAKGANAAQNNAEPPISSSLIKNLPASTPNQDVVEKTPTGSTKPDKSTYDAEQEAIKAMIDALQVKLVKLIHFHACSHAHFMGEIVYYQGQDIPCDEIWSEQ
jgi:hypothetical protein